MKTRKKFLLGFMAALALACGQNLSNRLGLSPTYPSQPANLKFFLTDKPLDNVAEVNVNIDHLELILEKNGKKGRLEFGNNLGIVNLLNYQNGLLLAISEMQIPDKVSVHQIRMILKSTGNNVVYKDGSICELKTPSAQNSGIKILLKTPVEFENDKAYAMVVDFDAEHSVVELGQGSCLLKPVLKLVAVKRVSSDSVDDDGESSEEPEDLVDGDDDNDPESNDGYDDSDPATLPPSVSQDQLTGYF